MFLELLILSKNLLNYMLIKDKKMNSCGMGSSTPQTRYKRGEEYYGQPEPRPSMGKLLTAPQNKLIFIFTKFKILFAKIIF